MSLHSRLSATQPLYVADACSNVHTMLDAQQSQRGAPGIRGDEMTDRFQEFVLFQRLGDDLVRTQILTATVIWEDRDDQNRRGRGQGIDPDFAQDGVSIQIRQVDIQGDRSNSPARSDSNAIAPVAAMTTSYPAWPR